MVDDPKNPNEYDEEAYLTALNDLTERLEDEVQQVVAALWAAGGTPGDIRNEFEELANNAIRLAASKT